MTIELCLVNYVNGKKSSSITSINETPLGCVILHSSSKKSRNLARGIACNTNFYCALVVENWKNLPTSIIKVLESAAQ